MAKKRASSTRTKSRSGRKAAPAAAEPTRFAGGQFARYCLVLCLAGAVTLSWLSLLTYSPTDPPATLLSPAKTPVSNAAGSVGAHLAYTLRHYLGGGAYMGLGFATIAAVVMVFGGRVREWRWRLAGVVLLITATSAALFLMDPERIADDYASGPAGVVGLATGRFLLARFAPVGSWVMLIIALCIGLMLTADNFVLRLPHYGKKAWTRGGEITQAVASLKSPAPVRTAANLPLSPRSAAAVPTAPPIPQPRLAAAPPQGDTDESLPSKARKVIAKLLPKPSSTPKKPKPAKQPKPVPTSGAMSGGGVSSDSDEFTLPSTDLLVEPQCGYIESQQAYASTQRDILQRTLDDFRVEASVVGFMTGPVITMFELSLAPGVKVRQIANLSNDVARALAVPGVRIVSPIPGKDTIGIEVPNLEKEIVRIKELMALAPGSDESMQLPLYIGKDASGGPIVSDLAGMPHMLIAGTTGSGKSVCINAIIMSMLMLRTPEEVRLILIDPKMVEMAAFENVPHLLCPIVNDMRRAESILEWAATKMDERYELLKEAGVKNIKGYNELGEDELYARFHAETDADKASVPKALPFFVIIVDELADLMMTSGKEVEGYIIRIAQKARAVGIHLVLATQRPSVNVVTGLIKSNMPCRTSFRVASRQESRIVLDQNGAEVLLGHGDMLFLEPGTSNLKRAQGAFVAEKEIQTVVKSISKGRKVEFNAELSRLNSSPIGEISIERDPLFDKAVGIILQSKRGSVSLLQRRLQIGYSRSSRIIDQMADSGILGDYKGSQAREVLMTPEDWEALQASIRADQSGASSYDGAPTSS
ncbi:MAG: DNA translocase FtsK 4TM domain-containing protein [Phycisphaerae bacterium]|jgi:S-DNA-T family DNA segregation ATPase FtsK/SpoIIIE|nr:DNA translocase FtsK 4TM domain-containing protein [Phycisphaerae bacterium]